MPEPSSGTSGSMNRGTATPQRRLIVVGLSGGTVFLLLVCIALAVVIASRDGRTPGAGPGVPTPVTGTSAPGALISPGTGGSVPLTLTAPSLVEFKNASFKVVPVQVSKGTWPYQRGHPDQAVWVFGTLINYIIGLEGNTENTSRLESLSESDSIQLTTYGGKVLTFRYSGRQWVTIDKTDIFRQLRPGLTLVLLGEKGEQRLVVSAGYVADNEALPSGDAPARPGTSVDVAGVRVQALGGKLLKNVQGLAAGNAYYQVDFTVTETGSKVVDASLFQMELLDGSGKRYTTSLPASQGGTYGPPGGQLLPGTSLTATAGFLVPDPLPASTVVWSFSPQPGQSPARFVLPVAGPAPTPDPRNSAIVQVTQARYSDDRMDVIVSGGIGNTSKQPITISLSDLSLQASGSLMPVKSTEPALPWVLQPGQNLAFTIHFSRPPAGTAVFRMLQASFELGNLQ